MYLAAKAICLIACHGGSADHFAVFAENLVQEGYEIQVYASHSVVKKFQERNIRVIPFILEGLSSDEEMALAESVAQSCSQAFVVLTDVGHLFDEKLQQVLKEKAPQVLRLSYYDNPEPEVPGGYSEVAAKVMKVSQGVLFANANLEQMPLCHNGGKQVRIPLNKRAGIGYYPLAQVDKITERRIQEREILRQEFLKKQSLTESGQKLFVYFGGNNEEYFTNAFPAFLDFLSETIEKEDLSQHIFILQQHPGAKSLGRDQKLLQEWQKHHAKDVKAPQIILSQDSTEDMQVLADAALYYQTSMGPIFALAGIPTIQVAHKTYPDVLVRGNLCPSVTNARDFAKALTQTQSRELSEEMRNKIFQSLGLHKDWFSILKKALLQEKGQGNKIYLKQIEKSILSNNAKIAWDSLHMMGKQVYQRMFRAQTE